ncbi:dihydroorotate dehydrogenase-like protein [Anaerolineales bacterium HSG25]|nr:dihydroorotate dehydrogenase-like protein [Anaerolineales bacterium HSG25]
MDLTTTYLGMPLKNPLVPSASPLSESVESIKMLEDAGASAVVMYSLFEEQITLQNQQLDHYLSYKTDSSAEALGYFPDMDLYKIGPEAYLDLISKAKSAVDIPIIGSLNGVSTGGWIQYAKGIEQAGASALELNIYYIPTDIGMTSADVEQMYLNIVKDVKSNVSIPVAVKISPYFSSTANMVAQLAEVGADGLVLFNRFYQPDFDLDNLDVFPHLVLSTPYTFRLPLRWTAILNGRVDADLAITSGVHTYQEVLKGMMAGAKITMVASELLRNGLGRINEIMGNVRRWMEENEYESITQMQGSMSQQNVSEPAAFERANYMKVLNAWRPDPTGHFSISQRLGVPSSKN